MLAAQQAPGAIITTSRWFGRSLASNGLLNGLLGYWTMDESYVTGGNRADATGNGWTATDVTGTIPSTTGLISNAASISTVGKGLSVSASIDTRAQTTAFFISFWFKGNAAWTSGNGISAMILSGGSQGWLLYPNTSAGSSTIHWYTQKDDTTVSDVASTTSISANGPLNGWQHIVAGYDGTNKQLYLNGALDASFPVAVSGVSRGHQALAIGNYSGFGLTTGQDGIYDEYGYWNRTLTASDVTMLYNGGAGFPFGSFTN